MVKWDDVNHVVARNSVILDHNKRELIMAMLSILKARGRILLSIWNKASEHTETESGYQCGWNKKEWLKFLSSQFNVKVIDTDFIAFEIKHQPK